MSILNLQKAWQQAIDEARLRQLQREEMADGELRRIAGLPTRTELKGGVCRLTTWSPMSPRAANTTTPFETGTAGTVQTFGTLQMTVSGCA